MGVGDKSVRDGKIGKCCGEKHSGEESRDKHLEHCSFGVAIAGESVFTEGRDYWNIPFEQRPRGDREGRCAYTQGKTPKKDPGRIKVESCLEFSLPEHQQEGQVS